MRNRFGKCLRTLIEKHEVKEQALADAINYNVTYISKWFNGAKLPSEKNVDRIISGFPEIKEFFERSNHANTPPSTSSVSLATHIHHCI